MYMISILVLMMGAATFQFSDAVKFKKAQLLFLSLVPLVSTFIYRYLLNMSFDVFSLYGAYCVWAIIIFSHGVLIASIFLNYRQKNWKALFILSATVLIIINLQIYDGHEGWSYYHRHTIWELFYHFH